MSVIPNQGWIVKINPVTGATVAESTPEVAFPELIGCCTDGGYVAIQGGVGFVYVPSSVGTATNITGSFGQAGGVSGADINWFTTNAANQMVITHMGTNPENYDYTNKVMQIAATAAISQVSTLPSSLTDVHRAWIPGACFFSSTEFVMFYAGTPFQGPPNFDYQLWVVTTSTGTPAHQINVVDQYGGEAYDGDIAKMTNGTFVNSKVAAFDFPGNTTGACFVADMFWYAARFINGSL